MLILTFIALSIINIVSFNKEIVNEYQVQTDKNILKQNTNNILKKINLSKVKEWEIFYINKNETSKNFEVFTWITNKQYKYIDNLWNKIIDITSFDKKIYARDLRLSTDIIKKITITSVSPNSFSGLVMHYDAQDTDWDWNISNEPANLTTLNTWVNKAWIPNANINWTPTYNLDTINTFPSIKFNWSTDYYSITDNTNINTASSYPEKSFAVVFRTWNSFPNYEMVIYWQWDLNRWYGIWILSWWILSAWLIEPTKILKKINLWQLQTNTNYYVILTQSTFWVLKWYLNWKEIWTIIWINDIWSHSSSPTTNLWLQFNWYIWEFISWNHTLTNSEIVDLKKYIEERWNMWKASILDNVNISIIVKDINLTTPH